MAITSLKPIKAKNKAVVVDERLFERASKVGLTKSEARGIFGSRSKPSGEVVSGFEDRERKKKVIVRTRKGKPRSRKPKHELPKAVSKRDRKRIEEHNERFGEEQLAAHRGKHDDVVERMRKRQEAAMAKVMAMEPRTAD